MHGSIGLIQASDGIGGSFTAETGSVGIDLRTAPVGTGYATAYVESAHPAGIDTAVGDIDVAITAGTNIGNVTAQTGSIVGRVVSYSPVAVGTGVTLTSPLAA